MADDCFGTDEKREMGCSSRLRIRLDRIMLNCIIELYYMRIYDIVIRTGLRMNGRPNDPTVNVTATALDKNLILFSL
jgi:hypothetical protein